MKTSKKGIGRILLSIALLFLVGCSTDTLSEKTTTVDGNSKILLNKSMEIPLCLGQKIPEVSRIWRL